MTNIHYITLGMVYFGSSSVNKVSIVRISGPIVCWSFFTGGREGLC